jgi:hypothetical protein
MRFDPTAEVSSAGRSFGDVEVDHPVVVADGSGLAFDVNLDPDRADYRRCAVMLCLHEAGMSDQRLAHLFGWHRGSVRVGLARGLRNAVVVEWCVAIRAFAEATGTGRP